MKHFLPFVAVLGLSLALLPACQDPITLGSDLLSEDQAKIGFADTIKVRAATILSDSVRTYAPALANQLLTYYFGKMEDPLFGEAQSTVYAQVRLERTKPDFSNSFVDSIVLVLPYDTTGVYGILEGETFGLEVYRLTEDIPRDQEYYSNASAATRPTPAGTLQFVPSFDSIPVIEYLSNNSTDTIRFPHLRVPLDNELGQQLLDLDTLYYQADTSFLDYFKGLQVRPTTTNKGLISFALNNSTYRGGIYLYYTKDDTLKRQFRYPINQSSTRFLNFQHNYKGSKVGEFLNDVQKGDSLVFAQGLNGVNFEVELLDLWAYQGVIINKAELVITLADLPENGEAFPPFEQLILSTYDEDGNLTVIEDVGRATQVGELEQAFGGTLDDQTGTYVMSISSYFQRLLEGEVSNKLVIIAFPKAEIASRAAFYGARSPQGSIKVRIAFTRL